MKENEDQKKRTTVFCDECNKKISDCFCTNILVNEDGKDFKWEYAHERISIGLSQFKEIMPVYD